MRVSIFGLGYAGAVASACLSNSGHKVIAVDTEHLKVKCIREGRSPVVEPGLNEMIKENVSTGKLEATSSCEEAILGSDISLICVDTPDHSDGHPNLDYIKAVCRQIGVALKKKDAYHSVVLRSTAPPGTAHSIAIPILEDCSGKKAGVDFGFGNNPGFLRESTAIYDYFNPPKIVIGALDERTAQAISQLYKGIDAPEVIMEIEAAEDVKYADDILKEQGADSHKVMDIFCLDTRLATNSKPL